jgi:transcriptional regulator with XRE-family HTH domain
MLHSIYKHYNTKGGAMRVRECREDAGYSIRELSEMAGVSHVTITHLENGRTVPHPRTLRKIAGALGVSVRELRGRDERPYESPSPVTMARVAV